MSIEVILADDHAVVRDGIKAIIERKSNDVRVIAEVANGEELLKVAKKRPPDVYIVDISMPIMNGLEATTRLLKNNPKSKIIILSMHDSEAFVEKAIKYGVKGYVLKESATEEILQAINEVHLGRFYISPKISQYLVRGFLDKQYPRKDKGIELTSMERRILQLIAEGYTTKEIAKQLKIAQNTAHVHRNNIMKKLDCHKQTDLIRYALKEGITNL